MLAKPSRDLIQTVSLTVTFMAATLFSLALTKGSAGVAAIWLSNGVLAAMFLLLPWRLTLPAAIGLTRTSKRSRRRTPRAS